MQPLMTLLALKIVSLAGATLNTLGFLSFFMFDSLQPWRWYLIGGGLLLIAAGELAARALARRMAAGEADVSDAA